MYFFIHGGGGLPKNYSDEGGGHAKKIGNWGGSYNFQITLLQIPPAPAYPIKNEGSLMNPKKRTALWILNLIGC